MNDTELWSHLYDEEGNLIPDKVEAELSDYAFVLSQLPIVYDAITNSRMSKITYYAHDVLAEADAVTENLIREAIGEVLSGIQCLDDLVDAKKEYCDSDTSE